MKSTLYVVLEWLNEQKDSYNAGSTEKHLKYFSLMVMFTVRRYLLCTVVGWLP